MTLPLTVDPSPLRTDQHGVIRIGGTRVTLDTVIYAFNEGLTAEEISLQYPTLGLADVYGAISYYLHHQDEVDSYLKEREQEAEEIRLKIEAQVDSRGIRERLLARRKTDDARLGVPSESA